jgi:hypothetical protein
MESLGVCPGVCELGTFMSGPTSKAREPWNLGNPGPLRRRNWGRLMAADWTSDG